MPCVFAPHLETGWILPLDVGGGEVTGGALTEGSISLVSKTSSSISLSASDATGGISPYVYQWYRDTSSQVAGAGTPVGTNALTLSSTGLSASTTYYFRIKYEDFPGSVVYSTEYSTATNAAGGGATLPQRVSIGHSIGLS